MLDLPTILLLLTVTLTLQGLVWLIVWLTQRHLFELRFLAAGFMGLAAGMLVQGARDYLPLPPAVSIILLNYLIHAGAALVAYGLARFLDQKGSPLLIIGCVVFTVIFWPAALAIAPENVAIRIIASNSITTVLILYMISTLVRDRNQPRALRWTTIGFLVSDAIALTLRTAVAITYMDDQVGLTQSAFQAWYFFSLNIFMTWLFLSLLLMVGVRLSSDLRQRNEELSREVTQRRALQDQLSTSLATEKALHEEQKQLLRMVTHEFRTPLAIVDRAAEMIGVVLERPPETVGRRLSAIREAVGRLVQLIDRFLDSERRNLNVLQPERIDIQTLLNGVRRHFEGMDAANRLVFHIAGDLPFYRGDAEMLSTVLINLIDNAVKYAPGDSPIEITARVEGTAIVIAVTDHGIGIPTAELPSIGQRFFRASNTTAATGTGLGLYNTRRLLDYHNGILSLRAGRGGGTVATIRLPLPGVVPEVRTEVA